MMKIAWYGALAVQVEHVQVAVDEKRAKNFFRFIMGAFPSDSPLS